MTTTTDNLANLDLHGGVVCGLRAVDLHAVTRHMLVLDGDMESFDLASAAHARALIAAADEVDAHT